MGRYTSLARITGSFNDATLCKDGTARMKTSLTGARWKKDPDFARSRDAAALFGGANACAASLFKGMSDEMKQQARPHAANQIANGLRALQSQRSTTPERYTFEEAIGALHRLDLSRDKTLAHLVQVKTIGHPLQPKGIHITGLKEAAEVITERCQLTKAGQQLQMRLHFGFAAFQELKYYDKRWITVNNVSRNHQPSTAWLPAESIPAQGLPMAIQNPDNNQNQILFMAVEWRQAPIGERIKTWSHKAPTQSTTPTQGPIKRRGKVLNDKIAAAQDPTKQASKTSHSLNSQFSILNPKDLGLFKIAALSRAQAQMHLPVPAYMQDTATRHFRIHPAKRKISRPPMSAALKFRTSLPLPQKQQQDIPQRNFVTFAPDLLPKRPNRQPIPEQQTPTTTKPAENPTSPWPPATGLSTRRLRRRSLKTQTAIPTPNPRTENPNPNSISQTPIPTPNPSTENQYPNRISRTAIPTPNPRTENPYPNPIGASRPPGLAQV